MSPTPLEREGKDTTLRPVGAGPFRFKEHLSGASFTVERFPEYWDQPKPYLDSIKIRIIPDGTVMYSELKTGGVHVGYVPLQQLAGEEKAGQLNLFPRESATACHLQFNCAKGVFQDERLRKAVSLTIDREAIVDSLSPRRWLACLVLWRPLGAVSGLFYELVPAHQGH